MSDDTRRTAQQANTDDTSISWWSWRPGIKPRSALLIGIPLIFIGFFFLLIGAYTLLFGIIDSYSPPLRVTGVVTGYTLNSLDSLPHMVIRVANAGGATTVSPSVTQAMRLLIRVGDQVTLDYSEHLRFLYALEAHGQRFDLAGSSSSGNPFGSIVLVLLGLALFPYPFLMALWGWRDLWQPPESMLARVVGLRASLHNRAVRRASPALTPRIGRVWYRAALAPINASCEQTAMSFSVNEEQYKRLREGQLVQITYLPQLHYVLSIKAEETQ